VERFEANPIIHREMRGMIGLVGENINGPSLIRVPDWIENPLGKYYLYFAHHHGSFIRLAYADRLEGPWKIYEAGVLPLEDTPAYDGADQDHVASPDVLMWTMKNSKSGCTTTGIPVRGGEDIPYQMSYVAVSEDGLTF
jgi:hypothetical protein